MKVFKSLVRLVAISSLILLGTANAALIEPEILTGKSNLVEITETVDDEALITYSVEILDPQTRIDTFAISNNGDYWFPPETIILNVDSTLEAWVYTWISAELWDEGYEGYQEESEFNTSDLGTFDEVFGDGARGAFIFMSTFAAYDLGGVLDDNEVNEFYTYGAVWSEFIALNNGTVVDRSTSASATQVPEPSTFAIFALGVIGLISRSIKK